MSKPPFRLRFLPRLLKAIKIQFWIMRFWFKLSRPLKPNLVKSLRASNAQKKLKRLYRRSENNTVEYQCEAVFCISLLLVSQVSIRCTRIHWDMSRRYSPIPFRKSSKLEPRVHQMWMCLIRQIKAWRELVMSKTIMVRSWMLEVLTLQTNKQRKM